MKKWFEIENKANNNQIKVSIVGDIGSNGLTAAMFKQSLDKHIGVESLQMDIYSQGGNMYDGLYMFDYLSQFPAIKTARVVNIAASAATLPLMAMDVVNMPANSKLMIHQPMAFIDGANSDLLRKAANHMDDMQSVAVDIYQLKTGLGRDKLQEMINAETYLTAHEAKHLGFADNVVGNYVVKNHAFDFEGVETIRDLESYLREVGNLSKSQAMGIMAKAKALFQREAGNDADEKQYQALQTVLNRVSIPKSII